MATARTSPSVPWPWLASTATVTFASVTMLPTERSMPFVRITNVSPTPTSASGSAAFEMPSAWMLSKLPLLFDR